MRQFVEHLKGARAQGGEDGARARIGTRGGCAAKAVRGAERRHGGAVSAASNGGTGCVCAHGAVTPLVFKRQRYAK